MTTRENKLGEYLKARRAQISPDDIGLPWSGERRVPGLRREEVAELAGLSVDYYTRLEQGRERHPSAHVLNALARTFKLGPDAQGYLFAIAKPGPEVRRARSGEIGQNLLDLINEWTHHPTTLTDERLNVVAANRLGWAIYSGHEYSGNHARLVFLDQDRGVYFREWMKAASAIVASLRATATLDPNNAGLTSLVGELTTQSHDFARLWAKAEVIEKTSGTFLVNHPQVGDLDLIYETFRPNSAPHLMLKVLRPASGTDTADKLAMLGSLTAEFPPVEDHADDQTATAQTDQ